jgi:hypothetical protein
MRQEAFESGYGWLGLRDFVVCVQSYKKDLPQTLPSTRLRAPTSVSQPYRKDLMLQNHV